MLKFIRNHQYIIRFNNNKFNYNYKNISRGLAYISNNKPITSSLPTIYALSTHTGKAAIAIVRVSGYDCKHIYESLTGKNIPKPRTVILSKLYQDKEKTQVLDNSIAIYFKAPKSYTGEDILEFHLHGGSAIIRAVLDSIKKLNSSETPIRYAEKGEFSRRAFINGRFDLTEAEGIKEMINAETETQRKAAISNATGKNKLLYDKWRNQILNNMALLTALIDFADDSDIDSTNQLFLKVSKNISMLQDEINKHLKQVSKSELIHNGIKLILLGPPNAGKSSLLNSIVNRDAVIVSDIAGTTRDTIDIPVDIDGYKVIIGDTAGIRSVSKIDKIEAEGIRRAKVKAGDGDVILFVLPINEDISNLKMDPELINQINDLTNNNDKKVLIALNKCDDIPLKLINDRISIYSNMMINIPKNHFFKISCKTKEGISNLTFGLKTIFKDITQIDEEEPIGVSQRVQDILENDVLNGLNKFIEFTKDENQDVIFATEELRFAADGIGKITGESIGVEEILGVVFGNFCIGK